MSNSEKLEIINQKLTDLYERLKIRGYTTESTKDLIICIERLELLKATLEVEKC